MEQYKSNYEKTYLGKNVVIIGGGSGLNTLLEGFKQYTSNITAIVTVSDYGEPKTTSRQMLETLPLDDVKDSLIAMEDAAGRYIARICSNTYICICVERLKVALDISLRAPELWKRRL